MSLTRRHFLAGGLSCSAILAVGAVPASADRPEARLFLSAARNNAGQYFLVALSEEGSVYYQLPVPERAHDSLFNLKRAEALYFGRSPSQSIYVVDVRRKSLAQVIQAESGRHFYGHGVIDSHGHFLYAVENNTHTGQGCIGIYDINEAYRRVGEWSTQGVGPHQLLLLSDNKTLAVANGGLKTTSSRVREQVSAAGFESSLVYIDIASGQLLGKYKSVHAGNSLRHMSINAQDKLFIGAQSYGDDINPLLFSHQGEEALTAFEAEDHIWLAHHHYTGSVAVSGEVVAITSPRGNVLSFWDSQTRQYLSHVSRQDIAGLSSLYSGQLFASTGEGLLVDIDMKHNRIHKNYLTQGLLLDNHLAAANICCPAS